jgi:hypothetical protein
MSIPTRASKACAILAIALLVGPALAQQRANAEELFQLGKGAMARQEYTKACNFFQASINAEFALGTLLNLAMCHEQAGKIASAWAEFRTLEDRARRATPPQTDRAQFAHERVEALRPRLSRVRILLAPETASTMGLVVTIDGVGVAPELFDGGVPVDLGKRKIAASAPERQEWTQVLTVDDERLSLEVTVPALRRATAPATPASAASIDLAEAERLAAQRSQRVVGFVAGGIGLASLATGAVFGLLAVHSAAQAQCPAPCFNTTETGSPNTAIHDAKDAYDRANTFGWVSNVTLATGVVGLAIGAYLVLTAKPAATRATAKGRELMLGGAF